MQPGYLVYTAKMDESGLACFWRSRCAFCGAEELSKRTFIDVYSNGVLISTPQACMCCVCDNARFTYFDKWSLGEATKVGCCQPCPWWCPHCFDLCGETMGFKKSCGCPSNILHYAYSCCCCCTVDVLVGLDRGQGDVLSGQINAAKARFHAAGNRSPPLGAVQVMGASLMNAGVQMMGAVNTAMGKPPGVNDFL
jgi:hypothetical protein